MTHQNTSASKAGHGLLKHHALLFKSPHAESTCDWNNNNLHILNVIVYKSFMTGFQLSSILSLEAKGKMLHRND